MRRSSTLHYLGVALVAFSALQAAPLIVSVLHQETVRFPLQIYAIPAGISLLLGAALVAIFRPRYLTAGSAMVVGTLGWFALSLLGAIPYWLALDITYLDALFETTSGFTTTGATLLSGLSTLPKSLLLWRGLTQWIGGLGIFTLFLFIVREGGWRHSLLGAETHKASSERFSPGIFSSLRILWSIYAGLTVSCSLLLWVLGLSPFDAAVHALTTVSTGGFSTYDASIAHFAASGYRHAVAIEYAVIAFMFLGGTSFLVHWNLLRRRWHATARNTELRAWLLLLASATVLVAVADRSQIASLGIHGHIRRSLFHVVSIATTTGFTTADLTSPVFSPFTRQILLLLMVIGGCVASTSGGLKVARITVLASVLRRTLRRIIRSPQEAVPLTLGRRLLPPEEAERSAAIGIAWIAAIVVLWLSTTIISRLSGWESLSAAVSAVSNIGPNYIAPKAFAGLGAGTKVLYILAMVAGRLEILPLLLIFSRRAWR